MPIEFNLEDHILEVVQAFKDGRPIEYRKVGESMWRLTKQPSWNFSDSDYRIRNPWLEVKLNTVILIRIPGLKDKIRHFAGYDDKKNLVLYYTDGATSHTYQNTGNKTASIEAKYCEIFEVAENNDF